MRFLLGNRKGQRRTKSIHCSLEKKRKRRGESKEAKEKIKLEEGLDQQREKPLKAEVGHASQE